MAQDDNRPQCMASGIMPEWHQDEKKMTNMQRFLSIDMVARLPYNDGKGQEWAGLTAALYRILFLANEASSYLALSRQEKHVSKSPPVTKLPVHVVISLPY